MNRVAGLFLGAALLTVPAHVFGSQIVAGGALSVGSPSGAFGDVAGTGIGFAASGLYYFGKGPIALRVSGTGSWYGTETLGVTGPGSSGITVDAKPTTFVMVGGPQYAKREGRVRPYANALAGFAHFSTSAKMEAAGSTFVDDGEFQDDTFAWSLGGGVLVPISRRVDFDGGLRFTGTGEAELPGLAGFERSSGGQVAPLLTHDKVYTIEAVIGITFAF